MKTTKRLLSLVLVMVMLIGMFPAQANAATTEHEHDHGEATVTDVQPQATDDVVKVEHDGTTTYYADLQKAFDGFAPSNNTYGGKYVVTLMDDVNGNLSKNLQYPTEVLDITLDLNGHAIIGDGTAIAVSINMGVGSTAQAGAGTFTLKDSSGDNSGKITGGKGGIYVYGKNVIFYFQSGTITGNHGASKGGGILVGDTTKFVMTGGVVTGNSVTGSSSANSGYGGGVLSNFCEITGGEITGNVAYKGSHVQSGRGGGLATNITGTAGYKSLTIADGVIYGNTAENAGDDVMAQGNGSGKFSLFIGTENWFIDGWNGTKATSGNGETARYDELDPVPYTDGGFVDVSNKTIGLKYFADPYDGPIYAITYTDGVEGEEVFADQTYKGRPDKTTPAFKGTPSRIGYVFAGWSPEVPEYPSSDMTFVAQWVALPAYTVTYTDGVEGEEIFPDQVYNTYEGYETPAFQGTPTRAGYIFTGWTPELIDTVNATVVYTATWRVAAVYTITYTDGVDGEEIFPDQVFEVEEQQATPKYTFDGKRVGYTFSKWNPTVAATVTGDATYTAVWVICSHSWGTPVFDEEALTNIYTCSKCGQVKTEAVAAEIDGTYYATLQAALTAAQTKNGNVTIKVLSDVEGAFTFKWTPVIAALNLTIDLNGHTITGTGAASVLTLSKSKSSTVVLNLIIEDSSEGKTGTITGGKGASGGAIAFSSNIKGTDSLTINGGNFKNNTATSNGGVASCSISGFDIVINGGVFENNTATGNGGAFYAPNVTINGGTFTGNTAESTTYGGGAVYSSSTLTIAGGTFTGNTAVNGGAIYVTASKPVVNITGGKIYGNTATGYGDDIVFKCTGSTAPTFNLMAADTMGVDGITNWYVDGFCGPTAAGQTDRFDETVKIYEKPTSLTKSTIALKAACHYTITYTDGVEGEEIFADQVILAGAGSATPAFEGEPVRDGFTFTGWTPGVAETVTGDVTYTATWKENAKGAFNGVTFRGDNEGLSVELENLLAYESVQIKVYFGETLLTTVSWRDEYIEKGVIHEFLTASVRTGEEESTQWAATEWTAYVNQVPTKLELYVDGVKMDELSMELDAEKWAAQAGVRVPVMGEIIRAWLNPANGRLMVDLENLGFEQSVVLELYSGETLLTSSSLNTAEYGPAIYAELTGNIGVQDYTASDTWPCQEWTAWDDVVPTAVKLVVDGQIVDVCEDILINGESGMTALTAESWTAFPGTLHPDRRVVPALPENNGSNVTDKLITIICDTDETHTSKTYGWEDPAANFVFPQNSEPVWNEELNAWTIGVRIDSIETYYVNLRFSKEHGGAQHDVVGEGRIDTTLVWNVSAQKWQTLTGEPFEVHVVCQTAPVAPSINYFVSRLKIKMTGTVNGAEKTWFESLHTETVTMGEVYGNRTEGFFVDVTVALDESYVAAWAAKHGLAYFDYGYAEGTAETATFTLQYTGNTAGELYDGPEYWAVYGDNSYAVSVVIVPPAAPTKFGDNVTPDLIQVICDSDPDHAPMNIKWQHQSTEVYPGAQVEWNEELNVWTVKVRIDSVSVYYVWLNYEKAHNDILHPMVDEDQKCIDTYLKWDDEKELWVTMDGAPIAVHVTCQTKPVAPATSWLGRKNFQIQVKGDLDGNGIYGEKGELYAASGAAESWTVGEVYGSREEGFFVDVTLTLENGDKIINTWIEKKAPGEDYVYNWNLTEKSITITLKYNRSTTGTLYGDNESDWVNAATGESYGKIGEAFVIPAPPAAPKQQNVTDKLVTIICDSDGDRHETVYGKWYPQHCKTTADMVWSDELGTWTVDVRIGSLYIMYVDQLEDANNGTIHELVEDITTVYSTLKWDAEQQLWVPVEAIELHTTCRTAPLAPVYRLQLEGYQVKVWGDINGELKAWTTTITEDGFTLSEVYGSREEGFFVDVTVKLSNGDAYSTTWNEKRDPCETYIYDWSKTEETVTFTLKYNGNLNSTLYGDRHSNVNYDWVLLSNGKHFGVITEAYVVVDPNGPTYHDMTSVVTAPTCTEPGYTTHTCSICGDVIVDTETEALGHDWSDWVVVKESTLTVQGQKERHCLRENCGCVETEAIPVLEPLATPAITKLENTAEGIKLTWGAVEGAERYRVYVKVNGVWKTLGTTTGTSYVYTGAVSGETYTFTIRCVNDENTFSTSYYNTTGWKKTYVAQPTITGLDSTPKGVEITWDAVPGAAAYRVYVKNGNAWKVLTNTTGTSYLWTGAETNTTYTFTIRCVDADMKLTTSSYNAAGWSHKFYPAPVITKFENLVNGIKITWNPINGAERYRVYIKNGNTWKALDSTTETSYVYTGAVSGETYTFTIRAVNPENTASVSNYYGHGWAQKYVAQPSIAKMESTPEGILFTWDAVPGAEHYRIYIASEYSWEVLGHTDGTSFTWTGAEAGKSYTFTIRCSTADNSVSTSSYSNEGWTYKYYPTPEITELKATDEGIQITWGALNGAERYRIYVKNGNGWKILGTPTENTFLWTGAEAGKTYTFTVRSVDAENTYCTSNYNTTGWTIEYK